ncbi:MAG: UDP-glucuronosyltransferase [Bacillaceae bacterium]|nr:UDP-glucuronosyltransferase [Bacillaceae bacterium]
MKKVLFLPFLQIPSGHHQVADSLKEGLKKIDPDVQCEKVDIFHYRSRWMQSLSSYTYLKWIRYFPNFYSWLYHQSVYTNPEDDRRYRHYELLFLKAMKRLIDEQKPDLLICTHALPSYMISRLKENQLIDTPAINVYTDYFIHQLWGISGIDFHFVPSINNKQFLLDKGVHPAKIFVTGIPVHHKITKKHEYKFIKKYPENIIITGGNLGVGVIDQLIKAFNGQSPFHYYVLCGKNTKLYHNLSRRKGNFTPLPYISSRDKMNDIYEHSDAIITKPGGVTISESLMKRLPIFVYHALPGQEEINLKQLSNLGVVHPLHEADSYDKLEERIIAFFSCSKRKGKYKQHVDQYHEQMIHTEPPQLIYQLMYN